MNKENQHNRLGGCLFYLFWAALFYLIYIGVMAPESRPSYKDLLHKERLEQPRLK